MNTHKEKDLSFWEKLKGRLAAFAAEAGAAQEDLDEYPEYPVSAVSYCRTGSVPATSVSSCPAATPPPHVTPRGAGEYHIPLTAAQLGALSRAVESELLSFVRHDCEDDSLTYRTTLAEVFQAIRAAERTLTTAVSSSRTSAAPASSVSSIRTSAAPASSVSSIRTSADSAFIPEPVLHGALY